jgi:lipoyl synthase
MHPAHDIDQVQSSPEYVRLSLAAAMTLGFAPGWFYRNAKLRCVNLLLTYPDGCKANCAFCGIAAEKNSASSKKFIRVTWKTFHIADVIRAIKNGPSHVQRICISMVTHPSAVNDTIEICRSVTQTDLPVSLLIGPTVMNRATLDKFKAAGADRIGVAIDCATPELFETMRGRAVNGPHKWDKYWDIYGHALDIFGKGKAGVHLIVGLGETEKEMVGVIDKAKSMGGSTHLFSFFPERGSLLGKNPPPPMGSYRRIQLARWLIDNEIADANCFTYDASGRIKDYGLDHGQLTEIIATGTPFETSGCPGADGKTACNRPYGNERPGEEIRNYPFAPEHTDIELIFKQITEY